MADANNFQGNATLRQTIRPLIAPITAGLLAGIVWGVVWPLMDRAGVLEIYDWQAWLAAGVAFLFISVALGDVIASFITPDSPERMDEDDLYEFREQAGIRRAFAFVWAAIGLTLVSALAFSQEYGMGKDGSVMLVNALMLNATFAIGYLAKKLDEYWMAEHAKILHWAFVISVFALGLWSVWAEAGRFDALKPIGVLAFLGASYLVAWAYMAWLRNRPQVEGYAPGR
ncbi:MAG: hypothetical protein AAF291_03365 [Pseudomonadota bacterium]